MKAAASGMIAQQARFEVLANNLANVDTPGFRRQMAAVASQGDHALAAYDPAGAKTKSLGMVSSGVQVAAAGFDLTHGALQSTKRDLDVAIPGDGFLAVSVNGKTAYTRAGAIQFRADGVLTDLKGNPYLDQGGQPITVPKGVGEEGVRIGPSGEVLSLQKNAAGKMEYVEVARLQVADVDPKTLKAVGDRLYEGTGTPQAKDKVSLAVQTIEGSNVTVVSAMTEMITALRAYEANSKVMQAINDVTGKAINDLK